MQKSRTLPPAYFLGALVLAVALHYALPLAPVIPRPWHLIGVLLLAIGLVFWSGLSLVQEAGAPMGLREPARNTPSRREA